MAETPEQHPHPDSPLRSSVPAENKPSTHHSPAPWSLHSHVNSDIGACFEIRDAEGGIVGYTVYSEDRGIGAIEWADAHLILAAPELLTKLQELYQAYLFLSGVADPAYSQGSYPRELRASITELLLDLGKAGVL